METLIYKSSIFAHVVAGILSLITGFVAMVVKKGGKTHNRAGVVFYWSMTLIFVSTIIFFLLDPTNVRYHFFLTLGIVSFYPNWSGKRMLSMKKGVNPTKLDLFGAWAVGISGIIMLAYAGYGFMNPTAVGGYKILFIIFGIVSLVNAYGDLKVYLGYVEAEKMHWFLSHAGKMIGAYSAAVSAFCVNIVPRLLPNETPAFVNILIWTMPATILGIISQQLIKRYKKKFGITPKAKSTIQPKIELA